MGSLQLYSDGGSRCNPGPSGLGIAGYHMNVDGTKEVIYELGVYLEDCSNNIAEYLALIRAINYGLQSDYKNIEFYSDSKLIVEQVNGRWKVKAEDLKDKAEECIRKIRQLKAEGRQITVTWIPREKNIHADSLANLAMDRKATAEYRRDIRQADKMQRHLEAMLEHEELINSITREPKRSKIRLLKESFDKVVETWSRVKI